MNRTVTKNDIIRIVGVEGFHGDFPFDQGALTWGDLRLIQRESGVRAGELDDELARGNVELLIVIASLALKKANHPHWRRFSEALDDYPLDADPPITYIGVEEATPSDPPNENGSSG